MGKVIFMKEQRVQELHGTFCGMVYRRTMKGETVVHLQRECREERKEVVRLAVALAQELIFEQGEETVERMQEVADEYHAMRQVIDDWYEEYAGRISERKKLVEALAVNYCNKFFPRKLALDSG